MVYLNGQFLEAAEATISALDRGFLYGDGLFETVRVSRGRAFLAAEHLKRLRSGAAFLGIDPILADAELAMVWTELIRLNGVEEGVLRVTVSRGPGPRGYSPRGAGPATLLVTVHPLAVERGARPCWRVVTSTKVRGTGPRVLCRFKTCNRLPQVLARAEAEAAGADEALMLDERGCVVEGSSANVFWVMDGVLWSPGPEQGALDGVTRRWVMGYCRSRGWAVREDTAPVEEVRRAEGMFLTLSTLGVVEVREWDGRFLPVWPGVAELQGAFERALAEV